MDGGIFGWMSILVGANTLLLVLTLLFVFRTRLEAPRIWIWSIRIGLVVLLLGSAEGGFMILNGGHPIGGSDGGRGLPVVH